MQLHSARTSGQSEHSKNASRPGSAGENTLFYVPWLPGDTLNRYQTKIWKIFKIIERLFDQKNTSKNHRAYEPASKGQCWRGIQQFFDDFPAYACKAPIHNMPRCLAACIKDFQLTLRQCFSCKQSAAMTTSIQHYWLPHTKPDAWNCKYITAATTTTY